MIHQITWYLIQGHAVTFRCFGTAYQTNCYLLRSNATILDLVINVQFTIVRPTITMYGDETTGVMTNYTRAIAMKRSIRGIVLPTSFHSVGTGIRNCDMNNLYR